MLDVFLKTFTQDANFWDNKNKGGNREAEKEGAENQTFNADRFKNDTKKSSGVKVSDAAADSTCGTYDRR